MVIAVPPQLTFANTRLPAASCHSNVFTAKFGHEQRFYNFDWHSLSGTMVSDKLRAPAPVAIRPLAPYDDMAMLTELIHAAYARRAADNLRYWATHQTVEDTATRFMSGQGFVAEFDARIVGTLTVRPPKPDSEVPLYREPATWTLCQFAVLPSLQRFGIGRRLHDAALEHARFNGARVIALDTAAPAGDLIDLYRRWGYTAVGECDWRPHTNYLSVVMSRPIPAPDASFALAAMPVVAGRVSGTKGGS